MQTESVVNEEKQGTLNAIMAGRGGRRAVTEQVTCLAET